MAKVTVNLSLGFPQSVEELFNCFAEHENQAMIFNVRVERLSHGKNHRNGVGSSRRIYSPPLPAFEETITLFWPNERIEYQMSDSWKNPIKGHRGVLTFAPSGSGTLLDYTISFETRIPFTSGMIKSMTESNLRKGLEKVAMSATREAKK